MGLSCSWVAVKGGKKDEILKKLDLVETGQEVDPGCDNPGSPLCYFEWPTNWFILVSEDFDWVSREKVFDLSQFGLTLGYNMLENVEAGFSTVLAAENGVVLWRVAHNGNTAKIEVSGNPPEEYVEVRDQIMRKQEEDEDVNYLLDIPTELAKAVTGYRLDDEDVPFHGLRPAGSAARAQPAAAGTPKRGFFRTLFSPPSLGDIVNTSKETEL
jgi:hypothetical protein